MAAAGGRATNTAVKLAFEPPVQRLVGRRGRVSAELVYSEQSCFAYNQGGSRRATTQAGKRRREVAPKYIKIPQVSVMETPMELALIRVQLCVIQHFDQHERTEPDPERQPMEFEPATLEMDGRRWILSKEDHLGASRCAWQLTFLDGNKSVVDELETPPFLLNCNRTQQRYTNALMLADRYLDENQPDDQSYFLREDASRLLSLYRKTQGNTTYMFENKLRALKKRLSVDALERIERALPRLRQLRQRQRARATDGAAAARLNRGLAVRASVTGQGTAAKRSKQMDQQYYADGMAVPGSSSPDDDVLAMLGQPDTSGSADFVPDVGMRRHMPADMAPETMHFSGRAAAPYTSLSSSAPLLSHVSAYSCAPMGSDGVNELLSLQQQAPFCTSPLWSTAPRSYGNTGALLAGGGLPLSATDVSPTPLRADSLRDAATAAAVEALQQASARRSMRNMQRPPALDGRPQQPTLNEEIANAAATAAAAAATAAAAAAARASGRAPSAARQRRAAQAATEAATAAAAAATSGSGHQGQRSASSTRDTLSAISDAGTDLTMSSDAMGAPYFSGIDPGKTGSWSLWGGGKWAASPGGGGKLGVPETSASAADCSVTPAASSNGTTFSLGVFGSSGGVFGGGDQSPLGSSYSGGRRSTDILTGTGFYGTAMMTSSADGSRTPGVSGINNGLNGLTSISNSGMTPSPTGMSMNLGGDLAGMGMANNSADMVGKGLPTSTVDALMSMFA